ncbi:type II toxin-antitoxin system RatA family toxin [Leptolyngbya sp. 15MV]|nr:type II toxin-antitoxin system RatA family toxin [Leptolyngbya sp. 15MV]
MPTHAEKKVLPYTRDQLFDVVADVRRYPEFLPWCVAARVISHTETELVADLTIGFRMFRETFRSQVTLERTAPPISAAIAPLRVTSMTSANASAQTKLASRLWV